MTDFVEDWSILHTLGEGAFGEVKLLVHSITGDAVAVKIIDCEKHKDASNSVKKEVCIHRILSHPNIIRYFGQRKENLREYIFLEYASGGELFNKIEPDVGMPLWEAQKYFHELLLGVEYLHTKGVAHRDLKPENLLLDQAGTLKITDFGMATMFRMRGRERLLDKRCGTLPYIPPEVLERSYSAQPADLWSCGVVLVAMLSGELPWDQPTSDQPEYEAWKDGKYMLLSPWKKINTMALSLIRCILTPDPKQRYTLDQISRHRWLKQIFQKDDLPFCLSTDAAFLFIVMVICLWQYSNMIDMIVHKARLPKQDGQKMSSMLADVQILFKLCIERSPKHTTIVLRSSFKDEVDCPDADRPVKRLCSTDEISLTQKTQLDDLPVAMSQPVPQKVVPTTGQVVDMLQERNRISFSQPVHFDDLILGSQIQFTQTPIDRNNFQKLVCRMTRFFVTTDCEKTLKVLCAYLEKHSYTWNTDNSGLITVSTVDLRKMPLVFKANIINMDGKLLLDFRLSKGCGLEFKRRFMKIKNNLRDIICRDDYKNENTNL